MFDPEKEVSMGHLIPLSYATRRSRWTFLSIVPPLSPSPPANQRFDLHIQVRATMVVLARLTCPLHSSFHNRAT